MNREKRIAQKLAELQPSLLRVSNESHLHAVPAHSETHFNVLVVSEQFAGIRTLERHRMIYALLGEELSGGLHALSLHVFTKEEWEQQTDKNLSSPPCLGGGRHG